MFGVGIESAKKRFEPLMDRFRREIGRRVRQTRQILKHEGPRGLADRVRRSLAQWMAPQSERSPFRVRDVLKADLSRPPRITVPEIRDGEPIIVNWVMVPPGPRGGGHGTIFRIIRRLEQLGYENRVYFYNIYRGDHDYYSSVLRQFYGFHGFISDVDAGMNNAHAVVATAWATAYPVWNTPCAGKRFYFVQDFEPYFHPVGALSLLAENTYRMGFHAITAGRWLAQKLNAEYGMSADSFNFGCDTSHYGRLDQSERNGVVFYARPEVARRGFELGVMALEIFARRHPEIELHFYGNRIRGLPFRFVNHGRLGPDELNRIYNRCYAGLSLSMTNVSLVPHEMLAAGCIPVVNEAIHNRIVLDNRYVRYVRPYPEALASELEAVVTSKDFESLSCAAAASVRGISWEDAGSAVDAILRRALQPAEQNRAGLITAI